MRFDFRISGFFRISDFVPSDLDNDLFRNLLICVPSVATQLSGIPDILLAYRNPHFTISNRFPAYWIEQGFLTIMKTMKALVKAEKKPGLWLQDVPVPEIGINDVLIRVHKTGICGTDLHIYKWYAWAQTTIPMPMVV